MQAFYNEWELQKSTSGFLLNLIPLSSGNFVSIVAERDLNRSFFIHMCLSEMNTTLYIYLELLDNNGSECGL